MLQQLVGLHNEVMMEHLRKKEAEEADDMQSYLKHDQLESNARSRFEELSKKYQEKSCNERTGDPPMLSPYEPVSETLFE